MSNIMEVHETNQIIEQEKPDVRTITIGILLLDCASGDVDKTCDNIYRKITIYAKDLVSTGKAIEHGYGTPIANKRITVTLISLVDTSSCKMSEDFIKTAYTFDKAARKVGVDLIDGYSAFASKPMTPVKKLLTHPLPQALSETDIVCSSMSAGSTKTGIGMNAVELFGHIIRDVTERTADNDPYGCVKFVTSYNVPDNNPLMVGGFHGATEGDMVINIGVSGPSVVSRALDAAKDKDFELLCKIIRRVTFRIARASQPVAQKTSRRLGTPFGTIDPSLAPTPAVGDSVGEMLEKIGLEQTGAPGTTTVLAMLNDQVEKGSIMASPHMGGLPDASVLASRDKNMVDAISSDCLTIEKFETMTCVCSAGLDMIVIPDDTSASTISGLVVNEAAVGMVNWKTIAARVISVAGKGVGEIANFGGLMGYASIMPINQTSCEAFMIRDDRTSASIHSFKN